MDKYYVYYNDDYPDMGGIGFEEFDELQDALNFIQERISRTDRCKSDTSDLTQYRLIKGKEKTLKAKEVISRIVVE